MLTENQRVALDDVRGRWDDVPADVGVADGDEDDFGDLIADTLEAIGFPESDLDDEVAERAYAAAVERDDATLEELAERLLGAIQGARTT